MKFLFYALLLSFTFNVSAQSSNKSPKKIEFTLLNKSDKSIPLIIPKVMNPNLSPFSSSGVGLKVGQKVLFRYKGKKRILLVVTEDLEGKKLVVNKLLKERKEMIQ